MATVTEQGNFLSARPRWPASPSVSTSMPQSPMLTKVTVQANEQKEIISDIVSTTVPNIKPIVVHTDEFDLDLDDKKIETENENDEEEVDEQEDEDMRELTNSAALNNSQDSVLDWLATESFESMDGDTLKKSFENHDVDYDALIKNPDSLRKFLQNVRSDLESRGKAVQSIDLVERLEKVMQVDADAATQKKEEQVVAKVEEIKVEETKVENGKVEETKVDEIKVDETKVQNDKVDEIKINTTNINVAEIKVDDNASAKDIATSSQTENNDITATAIETEEKATVEDVTTTSSETDEKEVENVTSVETKPEISVKEVATTPEMESKPTVDVTATQKTENVATVEDVTSPTASETEKPDVEVSNAKTDEKAIEIVTPTIQTEAKAIEIVTPTTETEAKTEIVAVTEAVAVALSSETPTPKEEEKVETKESDATEEKVAETTPKVETNVKLATSEFKYVLVGIKDQKPDIFEIEIPSQTEVPESFASQINVGYAIHMRRIEEFEKEEIRYSRGKAVARQLVNIKLGGIERKEPFLIVAFKDENSGNTAQFRILTHRMALKNARGYEVDTLHFARDMADLESHLSFKPCSKVMEDGTTKTMWQHFWLSDSRELCVHVESCK